MPEIPRPSRRELVSVRETPPATMAAVTTIPPAARPACFFLQKCFSVFGGENPGWGRNNPRNQVETMCVSTRPRLRRIRRGSELPVTPCRNACRNRSAGATECVYAAGHREVRTADRSGSHRNIDPVESLRQFRGWPKRMLRRKLVCAIATGRIRPRSH